MTSINAKHSSSNLAILLDVNWEVVFKERKKKKFIKFWFVFVKQNSKFVDWTEKMRQNVNVANITSTTSKF